MSDHQTKDPLHGVKLETIITYLVENLGWENLAHRIKARCFTYNPSIKSSLTFLRKTDWARKKVEEIYVMMKTNEPTEEDLAHPEPITKKAT
ncbi:MAG: transporter [Spirochaetes bacterium GWB1_48_6]|nr:MAG: transporter [Spirochaetes bacterium GWB1_48_6]